MLINSITQMLEFNLLWVIYKQISTSNYKEARSRTNFLTVFSGVAIPSLSNCIFKFLCRYGIQKNDHIDQFQTLIKMSSSKLLLYTCFCIANMMSTLLPIIQDRQHIRGSTFKHPLFQILIMSIGEMFCLVLLFLTDDRDKYEQNLKPPSYVIFILMLLDISTSLFALMSLNYLSGSVFSIISSSLIIFIAFFSKILLNKSFKNLQILGCMLTFIGALIAGLAQQTNQDMHNRKNQQIIGFAFAIASLAIQGLWTIFIQKIYQQYSIHPIQLVGKWGAMGTIFCAILLIILSIVACPLSNNQCIQDNSGNYHLQSLPVVLEDLGQNHFLLALILLNIFVCTASNYFLTKVIKEESAMVHIILSISNSGFIWTIGIIITIIGKSDDQYKIQSLGYQSAGIKLAGFAISIIGLLFYKGIICKGQGKQDQLQSLQGDI